MTRLQLLSGVALCCVLTAPAYAQVAPVSPESQRQDSSAAPSDQPSGRTAGQLEDIVVTAQRVGQNLQDVPVSITALSPQTLADRQILDTRALTQTVPNTYGSTSLGDPTAMRFTVRGIASPSTQLVLDVAVGVYVDGIYIPRAQGANVATIDMERLEVLRGPQGTLFGRNTIGGAFNITTNQPTDVFEGSVTAGVGNYGHILGTAIVNVPVSDSVATRFVYQHSEHSGYGRSPLVDDLNSFNQDYGRITTRIGMGSDWDLTLRGEILRVTAAPPLVLLGYVIPTHPNNAGAPASEGNPGDLLSNYVGGVGGDFYTSGTQVSDRQESNAAAASAILSGSVGALNVKSISAFRHQYSNIPTDVDGTPYAVVETRPQFLKVDSFSQEFQLYGKALNDKLSYIVGLYFFTENGNQGSATNLRLPNGARITSFTDYDATNKSYAAFAQLTYSITDELRFTGGLRYSRDVRTIVYHDRVQIPATGAVNCSLNPAVKRPNEFCDGPGRAVADFWPYTVGLDYRPNDDMMFYAKYSQGFRSGGFPQSTAAALPFLSPLAPERVRSPEVGFKLDLFDRKLRINGAAFYSRYNNIQTRINVANPATGAPVALQANAGTATVKGGELEINALLGDLRLDLSGGIADGKYLSGPFVGQPFVAAPTYTAAIAATYPIDTAMGELRLHADYGYVSKILFLDPVGVGATPSPVPAGANAQDINDAISQEGYGLLNARITMDLERMPLSVSAWARNITGKKYKVVALNQTGSVGTIPILPGDPFTFGLTASYSF